MFLRSILAILNMWYMKGMKINTKNIVKGTTDPMQGLSALTKVAAFGHITSNQTKCPHDLKKVLDDLISVWMV